MGAPVAAQPQAPAAQPEQADESGQGVEALRGLLRMALLEVRPVLRVRGGDLEIVTQRGVYRVDRETLRMRSSQDYEAPRGSAPWPADVPLYDYDAKDLRAAKPLEVRVGATVVLSLESNPTTGYDWQVAGVDEEICTLTYDGYFAAPAPPGMVGSGGAHLFEVFGLAPGETELTFTYRRPWEGGETAEEHTVHLTVLPAEAAPEELAAPPPPPAEG